MPLYNKEFPDSALEEAVSINLDSMNLDERPIVKGVTIDGPDSKDLDDGLNLIQDGNFLTAEVSIADVTSFIKLDSELYNSALDRLETIYLPNSNIPMLPYILSEDRLSLMPDGLRPAITFFISISKSGEIQNLEMKETSFRNLKKTSYREFDYIVKKDINHEHHELFNDMLKIAETLISKRRSKGALAIYDLKKRIYTNEEGVIKPMTKQTSFYGNLVVQEFALLANIAVSWYFANADIPFLFRNHTVKQSSPDRSEIIDQMNKSILDSNLFLSMRDRVNLWFNRAEYGPTVIGHFGLNEPVYTHITSPLRRFADMINHYIVKAHIKNQLPPFEFDELADIAEDINRGLRKDVVDKSDFYKKKVRKEAKKLLKRISESELDTINDSDYINLLRSAVDMDSITDKFRESIFVRLASSNVNLIMMYIILFKSDKNHQLWIDISKDIVKFLSESKGLAFQLMNILSQKEIVHEFNVEIDAQEGRFSVISSAVYEDVSYETTKPLVAVRKKDAVNKSAFELLLLILGIDLQNNDNSEIENTGEKLKRHFENGLSQNTVIPDNVETEVQQNYVGKLLELCMVTTNLQQPRYEFKMSGQSHAPVITCYAEIIYGDNTIKAEAVSSNKKEAKQIASREILNKLNSREQIIDNPPNKQAKSIIIENYIGKTNEICSKLNLKKPEYVFNQSGMIHNPIFECSINITIAGQIIEFQAEAGTKKEAKHRAAELCYNYLTDKFQVLLSDLTK